MLKKNRRVCDREGNMQKAVLFFIFCVLLCEVSPKAPIRKEDLLNKKAALSKQLSPNVPKWEDLASKYHTKEKPSQNKSKTLMNLLKNVTAKEVDIPDTNGLNNDTISNSTLNNNATNNKNLKSDGVDQNNTNQIVPTQNNTIRKYPIRRTKLNHTQANATVPKTPKKYAANETIGAKLAFFLLKNANNSTKEKPNAQEFIAPTMIPIFRPMPSSTKNSIPQPLANELIRKENFVPKELNPQQLKNLDNIEFNPDIFNQLQNKAVLNPLLATESGPKENMPRNVHLNPHPQNSLVGSNTQINEENKEAIKGFNPAIFSHIQNGLGPYVNTGDGTQTNSQPGDITLNYVDPQNTHRLPNDIQITGNNANIQEAQSLNTVPQQELNMAVTNQFNHESNQPNIHMQFKNHGPQYDLTISPPIPRNANTNTNPQNIPTGYLPSGLNAQLIPEELHPNLENNQNSPNQHGLSAYHNNFAPDQTVNHYGSMAHHNDLLDKQKDFVINQHDLQANKNGWTKDLVNQHDFSVNQHDFKANKNNIHFNSMNANVLSSPESLSQKVVSEQAKITSKPKIGGFNLPCLKASDVLDEFKSTPNCCQQSKPIIDSITENPMSNLQCEKPISVAEANSEDESVAIVFKPKNISLLKFYGDLLKKITLTVLVPYHISKLTS